MRRHSQLQTAAIDRFAEIAPLPLSQDQVAAVGPVRAAFDAVKTHPLHSASFEEARGDEAALSRWLAVSARLIRLTAQRAWMASPHGLHLGSARPNLR